MSELPASNCLREQDRVVVQRMVAWEEKCGMKWASS